MRQKVLSAATFGAALAETSGVAVGSFSHGFYATFGSTLIAVGGPAIPPGPIHVTLHGECPTVADGASVIISRANAELWAPEPLLPAQLGAACTALASLPASVPEDLETVWPGVQDAAQQNDLEQAAQLLQGRGSGLTPTGDDVLAALLLLEALDGRSHTTLADGVQTTSLSRAFLHWAARGQSIEPVHQLLQEAALGDQAATAAASERVAAIGGSSGQAILAGLTLGAIHLAA